MCKFHSFNSLKFIQSELHKVEKKVSMTIRTFLFYLPMILRISRGHTEDGGGCHVVWVLIAAEADDMGSYTLADVLLHTVQLCCPGNGLLLQQNS